MPKEAVDLSTRACWSTAAGGLVAPLLGRWRPSSEHARKRCAPACSSALPPRAPLARTAHHRRSCCVRARRIVPPEASARDVDFLLVSTAYLREPWCACSAMPAHAAPAALGLRVPALLRVCCASPSHACLRWHPHALCLLARAAVTTPTATSRTAAATPDVALALLGVSSLVLLGMLVVSGPPRSSRPVSRRRRAMRPSPFALMSLRHTKKDEHIITCQLLHRAARAGAIVLPPTSYAHGTATRR